MATKATPAMKAANNVALLNFVRTEASNEYAQRIPAATQGNIKETVDALFDYRPAMNEFIDTLVNRIGLVDIKSKIWTNPLAQFKRGMMEFGDTVEEMATTLLEAKRYDPNKCYEDVFKCNPPEVASAFHTINRQDYYELTINDKMLRRAFVNDYGLQDLLSKVMQTPYTSDYWDEYLIMKNLFVEFARNDWFYKVNVPDAAAATTAEDKKYDSMAITESVRAYAGKMKFLSTAYNSTGIPTFTTPDELILYATPDFIAMLDVNVIAFAFNASAADLNVRVVEIDDFGIDGCQAILADRDLWMCMDTVINFESIRNPKQMSWNYFLNHHGIYSMSRFVNAIMFTTEAGTTVTNPTIALTQVTVDYATKEDGTKPTFAAKGEKTRLTATVTGTVTPETEGIEVPQGVAWTITATGGVPLAMGTYIDAEGVLHVDAEEKNEFVTVTATTTYVDPNTALGDQTAKTATLNVGIGKVYKPGD